MWESDGEPELRVTGDDVRILWFSNRAFFEQDIVDTGTWLAPLGRSLTATGEVELCNITSGEVSDPTRRDVGPIRQWIVQEAELGRDGLPPAEIVAGIVDLARDYAPDIVHIWGAERFWGLLTARRLIDFPALLEIQGLKEPYSRVFAGGLTRHEQRSCLGLREIIKRSSIASGQRRYAMWSRFEREIIAGHRYITTQSPWVEAWVRASNTSAQLFHTELALRAPFYDSQPWSIHDDAGVFCMAAAYSVPYKGLHDAVRAFALLKRRLPHARLRVAGTLLPSSGIRRDGYAAWIGRLAASLHVAESIDWLGPLSAADIVAQLQRCSVMVMPSHCETYSVALAEALHLGVPAVCAHNGGADWLARDEESALFFSAGDEVMCSYQLERVLTDQRLALKLSENARSAAMTRNDLSSIVAGQIQRYRSIMGDGRAPAP